MRQEELCLLPATRLAALIRTRELSARDVLAAHLAQVERVNPQVNAIVTLTPERAMADARACDEAAAPLEHAVEQRRHACPERTDGAAAEHVGWAQGNRAFVHEPSGGSSASLCVSTVMR